MADSMADPRAYHGLTVTQNSNEDEVVLVSGGVNSSGVLAGAELYDVSGDEWDATEDMTDRRYYHTATALSARIGDSKKYPARGARRTGRRKTYFS